MPAHSVRNASLEPLGVLGRERIAGSISDHSTSAPPARPPRPLAGAKPSRNQDLKRTDRMASWLVRSAVSPPRQRELCLGVYPCEGAAPPAPALLARQLRQRVELEASGRSARIVGPATTPVAKPIVRVWATS